MGTNKQMNNKTNKQKIRYMFERDQKSKKSLYQNFV